MKIEVSTYTLLSFALFVSAYFGTIARAGFPETAMYATALVFSVSAYLESKTHE